MPNEAERIRAKYAGSVPVLVQRHARSGGIAQSPKSKYLIRGASKARELAAALRDDLKLGAAAVLYLYLTDDAVLDLELTLSELDAAHTAADGFLHICYSSLEPAQLKEESTEGGGRSMQNAKALLGQPSDAGSSATLQSPHGDRVPMGASAASCTFLNPRGSGAARPELAPSLGGRVPRALYAAVVLDVMAVGLVVPLLAAYSRELGGGPRFTGLLQAMSPRCRPLLRHLLHRRLLKRRLLHHRRRRTV